MTDFLVSFLTCKTQILVVLHQAIHMFEINRL